ncbi:MAG: hypothetical protein E7510_09790 [Ruminococcus sp.]|nr:hypothetical protein [Ruminococcus sp.]
MSIISSGYTVQCADKAHINQDKSGSITMINPDNEEVTLALVADGVSLGFQGKYASYNTVFWLLKWASEYFAENIFDIQTVAEEIQIQMMKYNHLLNDYSDRNSDKDTCCTVCGIVTDQKKVLIFNAGDSRLYKLSPGGKVRCMTQDDKAEDGYSIAMHIGGKNDDEIKLSFSVDDFHAGNCYILCTDGFYKRCDFPSWCELICSCDSRSKAVNILKNIADSLVQAGEIDDITVLMITGSE